MIPKKYHYVDIDGNHFPDADKGDDLYYALELSCWLTSEGDILSSATWDVSEGATITESSVAGTIATVRVSTPIVGTFKLRCTVTSDDSGNQQTNVVPMMLKVY
jgi:hypothetical protein